MNVNRTLRLFLLAILAAPPVCTAGAQEKIDRRWPLDADGMIRIYNFNGTVKVTGWNRDSVVVSGTTEAIKSFFGGGNEKALKLGVEDMVKGPSPRTELILFVPARARIWIRGANTEVDVRNVAGAVDVAVVSGRVRVAGSPSEVYVETMDGELDVEASPAFLRAKTATGRITWTGAGDEVALSTVSGPIVVNGSRLRRSRMESVTGDIRYTGGLKPDANATFDSHAGNITLNLAKEAGGELSVDAPFSTVLGKVYKGEVMKGGGAFVVPLPRGGTVSLDHGATITVRSFKGRVVVMQQ